MNMHSLLCHCTRTRSSHLSCLTATSAEALYPGRSLTSARCTYVHTCTHTYSTYMCVHNTWCTFIYVRIICTYVCMHACTYMYTVQLVNFEGSNFRGFGKISWVENFELFSRCAWRGIVQHGAVLNFVCVGGTVYRYKILWISVHPRNP